MPITPLVGRECEVAAVAEVLRQSVKDPLAREVDARLVITRRMAMPGVFSILREPGVDLRTAAAVLAVRDRVV